ncbi:MAG TPA: hypothetical protein VGK42_01045 [Candidatus Dormibacteraeota bacterium]
MSVLGFLIPVAVLGLIAWVIVGFTRARGAEPFTLATATALYARVALIAGLVMGLVGVGIMIKAALAFINLAYSYYTPQAYPIEAGGKPPGDGGMPPDFLTQQRGQDLVLGITLLVVGVLVVVAHYYLARAVSGMPGGSPGWITRGTLLAITVVTAIAGIPSAAFGIYQMLSYFIIGTSAAQQPWGESLGLAIAFVPAWIYAMIRLVQDLRPPPHPSGSRAESPTV